ncbi:uncharacterized protein LOC114713688 [Neltuma alba]|uniref:uncharacterized protein LOC114713688 n=1 Tax=Neltuma alba TaxID=207710 RepID=UPI0010A4BAE4|nr:uncharacterized protein LOC114713688 [Prosopis alba]
MNSIIKSPYSSALLPHNSHNHYHHNLPRLVMTRTAPQSLHSASTSPLIRKALPHSFVVIAASSSPPKSLDVSVFLQTSALLLFLYFTANFIVPELISKYFGFDKVNEEQNVNDGDR